MIVKTSPIICLRLQLYIGSRNGRNLCKQCVLANTDAPYTCRRCSLGAEMSTYNCRGCRNENPEFGEEGMEILLSLKYYLGDRRTPCPEVEVEGIPIEAKGTPLLLYDYLRPEVEDCNILGSC